MLFRSADTVFVGYGIDEPRVGINDYAGLDVRGKIVVLLAGYPKGMESEVGAHLSNFKVEAAEKHGAIGIVGIDTDQSEKTRSWAKRVEVLHSKGMTWMTPDGKPFVEVPEVWRGVSLNRPAAEYLFAGAPQTLADVRKEADKAVDREFAANLELKEALVKEARERALTIIESKGQGLDYRARAIRATQISIWVADKIGRAHV